MYQGWGYSSKRKEKKYKNNNQMVMYTHEKSFAQIQQLLTT